MVSNVQLRKGGAVHAGYEGLRTPACGGNKSAEGYRPVELEVTCKKCITYTEKHAERIAAEAAPVEVEPEAADHDGEALQAFFDESPSRRWWNFRKGRTNHLSTGNDETLCGRACEDGRYQASPLGTPCGRCWAAMVKRHPAPEQHNPAECMDLGCVECFPPYVPQVGDRIEDDHSAKLGQIRTVVEINGHIASVRMEGPMFHAAHYRDEILNADGTFARSTIRKVAAPVTPKLTATQTELVTLARQFDGIVYKPSGMATATANRAVEGLYAAGLVEKPWIGTRLTEPTIEENEMPTRPRPEWVQPVRRARLTLTNVTAQLSETGEILILADDAIRGPVEILLPEIDARWLRACVGDMGPLSED